MGQNVLIVWHMDNMILCGGNYDWVHMEWHGTL